MSKIFEYFDTGWRQQSFASLKRASVNLSKNQVRRMLRALKTERPDLARSLVEDTWGDPRTWMVGEVRGTAEAGLPVTTSTHKYLTALSLGPWRVPQQVHQKNLLLREVGDSEFSALPPETVTALPFRLAWQRNQATTLHSSLRYLAIDFDSLCERLKVLEGFEAVELLSRLSGVRRSSKCLDFFV